MKRTAKWQQAIKVCRQNNLKLTYEAPGIYADLAKLGYAWNSDAQEWFKTNRPVDATGRELASQFTDDDNMPSGIVNIRFMGHPEDVKAVQELAATVLNFIDVSDPYPNRKGPGTRIYTQVKRTQTHLRGRAAAKARGRHEQ